MDRKSTAGSAAQSVIAGGIAGGAESLITVSIQHNVPTKTLVNNIERRLNVYAVSHRVY